MRLGIIGAMPEEIEGLRESLVSLRTVTEGLRHYHQGSLWGTEAVLVFSRWGKVAAAATAATLLSRYRVDSILFFGVAGGLSPSVAVGDIVVGTELVQHDLDARPLYPRHEIPLLGASILQADRGLSERLLSASRSFVLEDLASAISPSTRAEFHMSDAPEVHAGLISSGDQFIASSESVVQLRGFLPSSLCVEMEGAAVAQVCHEYGVPFAIARVISDSADEGAPASFPRFVNSVASVYSFGILRRFLGVCD